MHFNENWKFIPNVIAVALTYQSASSLSEYEKRINLAKRVFLCVRNSISLMLFMIIQR